MKNASVSICLQNASSPLGATKTYTLDLSFPSQFIEFINLLIYQYDITLL